MDGIITIFKNHLALQAMMPLLFVVIILKEKRIGHSGTLDPGIVVLPVFLGKGYAPYSNTRMNLILKPM